MLNIHRASNMHHSSDDVNLKDVSEAFTQGRGRLFVEVIVLVHV